jgi:hypothetical protein
MCFYNSYNNLKNYKVIKRKQEITPFEKVQLNAIVLSKTERRKQTK